MIQLIPQDNDKMSPQYSIQTMVDQVVNFGKVSLVGVYNYLDTVLVLNTNDGLRIPDPSAGFFNMTWWNATDHLDPADDPNREIVRIIDKTGDILTIIRAQEGTGVVPNLQGNNHNMSGKTYKMILSITAKTIPDLQTDAQTKADSSVAIHRLTEVHVLQQPSTSSYYRQFWQKQGTVAQGIWSWTADSSQTDYASVTAEGAGYWWNSGSSNNLDEYKWENIYLTAGNYKLTIITVKSAYSGLMEVLYGSTLLGTYDAYNSSTQNNIINTISFTLNSPSTADLRIRVNGKNASSTGFRIFFSRIQLEKTG